MGSHTSGDGVAGLRDSADSAAGNALDGLGQGVDELTLDDARGALAEHALDVSEL